MGYFLRQDKKKKGIYLQMYERFWNKELKQARNRCVESFGYVDELKEKGIADPISHFKQVVEEKENDRKAAFHDQNRPKAFGEEREKNIGYFLLQSLIELLDVKDTIDILESGKQFQFSVFDMLTQLIYARVIHPSSKSKTVEKIFPLLYKYSPISEDQVYDGLCFIGASYKKYIELFNRQYAKLFERKYDKTFFDCTNYYFEIDLPKDDKQKGPSKENRTDPIIGQALLLDADMVPLAMQMYPGNESEKPYIRKIVEEMKARYHVTGKSIQVADKGLNCARNIYAAVKEANDGYVFSKSIHGTGLSQTEKEWLIREDSLANKFDNYYDHNGQLLYRIKSCVDDFTYHFDEEDPDTGKKIRTTFSVKEKRIVSFNPALAKKQRAEILKAIDKASNYKSYKNMTKEELGNSSKYVKVIAKDANGRKIKPVIQLDQAKIDEDLKYAGYNLIVTSEVDMSPKEIYDTYHNLWKIEESFRITKSYLDARPVYLQKQNSIYGHFLICYLSLFLLRVLEIKCFKHEMSTYDIIHFIRDFRVVKQDDLRFINISKNQRLNEKIKTLTGLSNIDALILTEDEIDKIFNFALL